MLFRDVKQGYPVYIFDRKDVSVKVGKVTNSPLPHFDVKMGTNQMVVDLNVETDGHTVSYVFADTGEVGYANELVISVNKEAILREIENVENQAEEALKMTDYYKDAVKKCKELLKVYSQEYKERTEAAERMTALENKVDKLVESFSSLVGRMDKERSIR